MHLFNGFLRILLIVALLCMQGTAGLVPWGSQTEKSSNADPVLNPADFKPYGEADARAWDGTIIGYDTLKNSKGEKVSIGYGRFMSAEAAQREIADDLRYPPNILEHGDAKDEAGHVVGERAVVVYEVPVTHEKYTAIVWNNGNKFHRVSSQSPAIAKKFEELIKAKDEKTNQSGASK